MESIIINVNVIRIMSNKYGKMCKGKYIKKSLYKHKVVSHHAKHCQWNIYKALYQSQLVLFYRVEQRGRVFFEMAINEPWSGAYMSERVLICQRCLSILLIFRWNQGAVNDRTSLAPSSTTVTQKKKIITSPPEQYSVSFDTTWTITEIKQKLSSVIDR